MRTMKIRLVSRPFMENFAEGDIPMDRGTKEITVADGENYKDYIEKQGHGFEATLVGERNNVYIWETRNAETPNVVLVCEAK